MIIKLNIKSIIKYELLNNKSFNKINYEDENDLLSFLYCIVLSNNNLSFTYDEFLEIIKSKKISKEIIDKFKKEILLIESFTIKNENKSEIKNEEVGETYIKDIASLLIINAGIDINYVMNDMSINEIPLFINAYNERVKQDMESKRLFTFLSILPHIDSSKINSPIKFYQFPWDIIEEEENNKMTAEELDEMLKYGEEIMNKIKNNEKI